ncbi:MAG: hypothetical protein ACK5IA_04030, partial [Cyanobacteriota bacterium]
PLPAAAAPPAAAPLRPAAPTPAKAAIADDAAEAGPPRPADLVVLQERIGHQGKETIGVFSPVADAVHPALWRVQLWTQTSDRVTIATDIVRCSPTAPMRVTGDERHLFVRQLNPGGLLTRSNRLDHLIWWAVCQPAQAGRDPATLTGVARQLGYSGQLQEREEVLPAPRR